MLLLQLKRLSLRPLLHSLMMMGLLTTLSACVTLKDHILYFPEGPGSDVILEHTETSTSAILSFDDWNTLISKTPLVCMSDTDYSDIKADIEKFCNDLPNLCSTDVTEEPNPSQAQMTARQIKFHFKKIERAFNRVRKVRGLSPKKY